MEKPPLLLKKYKLDRIKFVLAILLFLYSVFLCGFSYGFSLIEKMVVYEREVYNTNISISGGINIDFSDLLIRFFIIAVFSFLYILLTKIKGKLLFEVIALASLIIAIYQLVFFSKPGYLPGQTLIESTNYLQVILWLDIIFSLLGIVLIVMQSITIWRKYKNYSKQIL